MPERKGSAALEAVIARSNSNSARFGKRDWLCALLLVVVTLLAYQPAWNGKPVWDDDAHITKPALRSLGGLARIWMEPGATQQYYPLVHSFFWVEYHLWGDRTLGYHLINILLHVGCVLLLVKILRRLDVPGSWLAAAIFALHPVEVETVAWITELKNTLSGVCCLGAALVYLNYDRDRKGTLYAGALILFVLGLMSKTVIATLPASLLVVFWWQRGRLSWKKDVLPLLPFFAVGIGAGLFTAWMERAFIGAEGSEFNFTAIERCLIAGRAFWFYLGKLFWPANLVFIYPRWNVSAAVWWQYLFPAAALLLFAGLCWWRRSRGLLAGLLFFAGTLFPALGFFNVYPFRYSFVADHFQYLAGLGPIVLVAAGMTAAFGFLEEKKLFLRPVACGVLLVSLGMLTWKQSGMYGNIETLWQNTIARNPNCWMAYNNLGDVLLQQGNVDEAIVHYQKAWQIRPDFAEVCYNLGGAFSKKGEVDEAIVQYQKALQIKPDYPEAHNNLGIALFQKGKVDEAIVHYQKALQFNPDYPEAHNNLGNALLQRGRVDEAIVHYQKALQFNPTYAEAHNNLGNALLRKGKVDEAIVQYQKALQFNPDYSKAHNNLGDALLQQGGADEAIVHYQKALQFNPNFAEAHNGLGNALLQQGKADEAIVHYQKALEINPAYSKALYNLGGALSQIGKMDEAIVQYQKALQFNPDYPEAHNNLGNALLQKGRVDEAIVQYQKALQFNPNNPKAHNNLGLALFKKGEVDEAIVQYQKALQFNPAYADAHNNLGNALLQKGEVSEAIAQYQKVLESKPDSPEALNHLAWLLATSPDAHIRDGVQAVKYAERACELTHWGVPVVVGTLAAAYAEAGRFEEAMATAQKACTLASQSGDQKLLKKIQDLLALYHIRQPNHEAANPGQTKPASSEDH